MAANKFATMLHRNTNKITLILIYVILEWILIILLLLNSLFSYLIIKFADYFGLKRPCLWCSRLDHVFDPTKKKNSYRDLVCEDHATEISKLGFCLNHQKLSESQNMCEDCSSSSQPDSHDLSKKFAFFPWMKQIGVIQGVDGKVVDDGEVNLQCSCCGVSLDRKFYSPYLLIKPSWEVLDYTQKGNLIAEPGVDDIVDESDHSHQSRFDSVSAHREDEDGIEENGGILEISDVDDSLGGRGEEAEENFSCSVSNVDCKEIVVNENEEVDVVMEKEQEPINKDNLNVSIDNLICDQTVSQVESTKDTSPEILLQHLEFYIDRDDCHLIPIELIDSAALDNQSQEKYEKKVEGNWDNHDFILDFDEQIETEVELVVENRGISGERVALFSIPENEEESKIAVLESMELNENESYSVLLAEERDLMEEKHEQVAMSQATQTPLIEVDGDNVQASALPAGGEMDLDVHQVSEELLQMESYEIEADISIGTEIPDHEPFVDIQPQEVLPSYQCTQEDPSTGSAQLHADDDHGSKQAEEDIVEFKTIRVETSEQAINNHLSLCSEINDIEEEKVPDTPTSIDSLHQLHRKLLLLERKESGAEESLDGSVISDIEAGDGILTLEKMKSALRAERKALNALYTELEEERSASAVAANQTMAMINRLQEEKAAMQMEALQYQRMMEEQSEYDQEALQLLNEIMVKREKENVELEKELEIYRKKIKEYEAKERMMVLKRRKDDSTRSRTSSSSSSIAEDSDGLSVDLSREAKEEDSFYNHRESSNQNTPVDAVLYLDESLANFEEERLSILEQLKVLEEKLFTLNDEEEQYFEDIKPIEHFYEENGNGYYENFDYSGEENGIANGHSKEMNGEHHEEKRFLKGPKAKRLLPLFDAIDSETEDGLLNGNENGFDSVALQNSSVTTKFELDNKKLAIEEEVDHVYERLQALEADREFLKHCISSLRKGDKGIDLLQEILQHLRDLRNVELRVRNLGDAAQ